MIYLLPLLFIEKFKKYFANTTPKNLLYATYLYIICTRARARGNPRFSRAFTATFALTFGSLGYGNFPMLINVNRLFYPYLALSPAMDLPMSTDYQLVKLLWRTRLLCYSRAECFAMANPLALL